MNRLLRTALHGACCASAVAALAGPARAADNIPAPLITVNSNGGWSWFEDERAVVDVAANKLVVGTIANGAGFGGAARNGDVEVTSVDLTTHATTRFVLAEPFQADDHNSPALYIRPDGRYVAMYAGHIADSVSRWKVSTNPGSVAAWSGESTVSHPANVTYSNIHFLPGDNGGAGRLYSFARSTGFDPVVLTSNNQGTNWTYLGRLLNEGGDSDRPYLRYASNGDKIHFQTTTRHPRDVVASQPNGIYHGYVKDGVLYNSTGAVVDANVFDASAVGVTALTPVFPGGTIVDGAAMQRAWTVDTAIDAGGNPIGVFQARANGSDLDHRYFYSRWDPSASQWVVKPMAFAGSYLYAAENDYTGLMAIDPRDVSTVYVSTEVHPVTKAQLIGADGQRHYELFRGRTQDGGTTWSWAPITFNSTVDNIRPHVPKWDANNTALVWLRGDYTTYTSYNLKTVALLNPTLTEPLHVLSVDFGATGQLVQSNSSPFTRDATPAGVEQTESYASSFGVAGQIAVTVGGDVQFRDRGDDVAGPIGDLLDDYVYNAGTLTLTLGNLMAGDYQLVLHAHDRGASPGGFRIMLDGDEQGRLTPTTGATPQIGTASSRFQFHASGAGNVTISLESLAAGDVVLNGFELYAAPNYLAPPPVDLNLDGFLDLVDFGLYIDGMHRNLTGMTPEDAYRKGDLNGDLRNDFADFLIFRQAYNLFNGAGAFEAALAAPEPGAASIAAIALAALGTGRQLLRSMAPVATATFPRRKSSLPSAAFAVAALSSVVALDTHGVQP